MNLTADPSKRFDLTVRYPKDGTSTTTNINQVELIANLQMHSVPLLTCFQDSGVAQMSGGPQLLWKPAAAPTTPAYLTGEPATHNPCCPSHDVPMDCSIYRRTHLVETDNCCDAWAAREDKTFTPRGCPAGFSSECFYWTDSGTCRCLMPTTIASDDNGGDRS